MPNQKTTKKEKKTGSSKTTKKKTSPKKTTSKKQPDVVVDNTTLELELPWKSVKHTYDLVLASAAKNIKLKGFRQGKVPPAMAEEKIGRVNLIQSTLEELVPNSYQKLIQDQNKQPLTPPQITPLSLEWEHDWKLQIEIAEAPQITLGKYQQAVKKGLREADQEIKKIKKAKSQKKSQSSSNQDEHDHSHHTHNQDPQSQIRETQLHHIFSQLVETIQPQIPELLLKEETKRELNQLANELERIGLSMDDYLARRNQTFEDLSAQTAAQKLGQLQLEFILQEIQKVEKIEASEEDVQHELAKMEDEAVRKQVQNNPQYRRYLEQEIIRKKTLEHLLAVA